MRDATDTTESPDRDYEETAYLSAGIAQSLIRRFDSAGFPVIPWETASQFAGRTDPPVKLARTLNANKLLIFSVVGGETIETQASLVDGPSGLTVWSGSFSGSRDDLLELPRSIALAFADRLASRMTDRQRERLSQPDSASAEAWDLYMSGAEGLQANDPEAADVALQYFDRALELSPELNEAQIGRGALRSAGVWYGWGGLEAWSLARQDFEQVLQRDPFSMAARRGLMRLYYFPGRSESCLELGEEARRLGQPGALETLLTRAESYFFGGLFARSIPLFDRVIGIDPLNEGALWLRVPAAACP